MKPRCLVVAKAPVPGHAKTRLGADVGMDAAAELAAASMLDTLDACRHAFPPERRHLALDGDLSLAAQREQIKEALRDWQVLPQRGDDLAHRVAHAHADLGPGPVVQIGTDTPQVTADLLTDLADGLRRQDAVLGPAEDGGWWALALADARHAAALAGVPMSTADTGRLTHQALRDRGLHVGLAPTLRDVDAVADAVAVAAAAPGSRFARAWDRTVVPA